MLSDSTVVENWQIRLTHVAVATFKSNAPIYVFEDVAERKEAERKLRPEKAAEREDRIKRNVEKRGKKKQCREAENIMKQKELITKRTKASFE